MYSLFVINTTVRRNLIESAGCGGILLVLYFTGLHTEVVGFLQRGILKTGLLNPDIAVNDDSVNMIKADYGLRLINSKGENVNMEEYKGKVIFLNLWATWCPPCIAE